KDEILCSNSATDNTSNLVTCGTISPFFYDEYGNSVGDPTNSCDNWIVTSREAANGGSQPAALVSKNGTSGGAFALTANGWLDSTITCQKNGANGTKQATALVYGGLKNITASVTPAGPPFNIIAGNANLSVAALSLWAQKNGTDVGKPDAGFRVLTLTEDSALTTAQMGLSDNPTCNFNSSGVCTTPFNFNLTKKESGRTIAFSLFGKSLTLNNINISAGAAALVSVDAITPKTAGESFDVTMSVYDAVNNLTSLGCGDGDTPTGFGLSGGQSSPGGHGGVATAAVMPGTTTRTSEGVYQVAGIRLYNRGTTNLIFSACAAPASASKQVTVNEAALNNVTLHSADDGTLDHAGSLRCDHTGTGTDIQCNPLFAFFWDGYGNRVGSTTEPCDSWSWSNRTGPGATGTTPTVDTSGTRSKGFTHSSAVNGNLTCSKTVGGITKTNAVTNVYGGITSMSISATPTGSPTLTASNANLTLNWIQLNMKKGDAEVAMENAGSLPVDVTTDYTSGVTGLGQTASKTCAFDSTTGKCTANWPFNFTVVQSNVNLSF
ncbi:hypothetical protein EBR21_14800, partial [bacterium]|nr:hypothetical protein [bacterium]